MTFTEIKLYTGRNWEHTCPQLDEVSWANHKT